MKGSEEEEEFDCENCGACCRCFPIFAVEIDAEREPRIRKAGVRCDDFLGEEGKVAYRLFPLFRKEACVFLKEDQLCRIYETRPDACRRFEPGGEQCRQARRRVGVIGRAS
ncbi:MAG: zinc/iron-chelating domain-containing protein [Myxococcales bacterium]|nr:zinc/iron-chelating domain-containing protein [Myxococcales bacterium]